MKPIIDPRDGDIEDDASSTKRRSLFSLAGSLLVEISLPKLAVAWTLLIGLPGIILGIAPLLVRHQPRNRLAVPRDHDGLPRLDVVEKLGKMGLCVRGLDFAHHNVPNWSI